MMVKQTMETILAMHSQEDTIYSQRNWLDDFEMKASFLLVEQDIVDDDC